jgi:hypothetical protein
MIVYENSRFVEYGGQILIVNLFSCPLYGFGDYFYLRCEDVTSFIHRTHRPTSRHP